MQRTIKLSISTSLAALLITGTAFAGSIHDPGVNKRQRRQQHRIMSGAKSGALTPRETISLERQQVRIRKEEHRMKSDGVLTKKERCKLHHDLNRSNRGIYRQKHDHQHR
ncbi:MAG: hypothetical protein GXP58_01720 [Deltaproteobacteria bacterium]|nr:hypothetical protein [Deltaproteobacteria bacterium]